MQGKLLTDVNEIGRRVRKHVAAAPSGRCERAMVVNVLNEALAIEIVCALQYRRHYFMAAGLCAEAVRDDLARQAREEEKHAARLAERIRQLDGEPIHDPPGLLTRSHSEYEGKINLMEMVEEDLAAERLALESHTEIVRYLGDADPTSRQVMEAILAKEGEHAHE